MKTIELPDDFETVSPGPSHERPAMTGQYMLFRLIDRYGPWAVLAAFLVWWLTNDISANMRGTKEMLERHIFETSYYLRQVCLNTANDDSARANCQQPQR